MLNRWIGITTLGAMAFANTALFFHDLFPMWLAGEAPRSAAVHLSPGEGVRTQAGIFDSHGLRIGTTWTDTRATETRIRIFARTNLRPVRLQGHVTPQVVIRTNMLLDRQGVLDEIDMSVEGLGTTVRMKGELFSTSDFACQWQVGDQTGSFALPASATRSLGDALRPFDTLPDLFVGRVWRMELVNPLAHVTSRLSGQRFATESVLVRVTAEEEISHGGERVPVYRVEANGLRVWVGLDGRVLRQEIDLPLFGLLTIIDEPYSSRAWYSGGTDLESE
jgi:hypothetical protein